MGADAVLSYSGPFQEAGSGDDEKDMEDEGENEGGQEDDDEEADPGDTVRILTKQGWGGAALDAGWYGEPASVVCVGGRGGYTLVM